MLELTTKCVWSRSSIVDEMEQLHSGEASISPILSQCVTVSQISGSIVDWLIGLGVELEALIRGIPGV